MTVLLKRGMSASRDEAAEEMKECWSTTQPCCRSTVILQDGPSLLHGRLMPRSYHKLPEYLWTTQNPIYVFSKPFLMATLSFIHCSRLGALQEMWVLIAEYDNIFFDYAMVDIPLAFRYSLWKCKRYAKLKRKIIDFPSHPCFIFPLTPFYLPPKILNSKTKILNTTPKF